MRGRRGHAPSATGVSGMTPFLLRSRHQRREVDLERIRQQPDVYQAHVALASLDPTDVRPVEPSSLSQRLLAELATEPQVANGATEGKDDRRRIGWYHAATLGMVMTMSLQTMSIIGASGTNSECSDGSAWKPRRMA